MADNNKEFVWTIRSRAEGDGVRKTSAELTELEKATKAVRDTTEETTEVTRKATEATEEQAAATRDATEAQEEEGAEQERGIEKFVRLGQQATRMIFIYRQVSEMVGIVTGAVKGLADEWARGQGFADSAEFMAHAFGRARMEVDETTLALLRSKAEARAMAAETEELADAMGRLRDESAEATANMEAGTRALQAQLAARTEMEAKETALALAKVAAGGGDDVQKETEKAEILMKSLERRAALEAEERAVAADAARQKIAAAEADVARAALEMKNKEAEIEAGFQLRAIEQELAANADARTKNALALTNLDPYSYFAKEKGEKMRAEEERLLGEQDALMGRAAGIRGSFPTASPGMTTAGAQQTMEKAAAVLEGFWETLKKVDREQGEILGALASAGARAPAATALDAELIGVTSGAAITAAHAKKAAERQAAEEAFQREEQREVERAAREAERAAKEEERERKAAEKAAERAAAKAEKAAKDGGLDYGGLSAATEDLAGEFGDRGAKEMAAQLSGFLERLMTGGNMVVSIDAFGKELEKMEMSPTGRWHGDEIKQMRMEMEKFKTQLANNRSAGGN